MTRYDDYGYGRPRKGSKVFWIFFAIVAFCLLYFPLFGGNLKYLIGYNVGTVLTTIGTLMVTIGVIIMVIGLIQLLVTRRIGAISKMIFGFIIIIFGMWLINPGGNVFAPERDVPKGYH